MMILVKHLGGLPAVPREAVRSLALILSPFAPHLGEELWQRLGGARRRSPTSRGRRSIPALVQGRRRRDRRAGERQAARRRHARRRRRRGDGARRGARRGARPRPRRGQAGEEVHLREGQDRQLHRRAECEQEAGRSEAVRSSSRSSLASCVCLSLRLPRASTAASRAGRLHVKVVRSLGAPTPSRRTRWRAGCARSWRGRGRSRRGRGTRASRSRCCGPTRRARGSPAGASGPGRARDGGRRGRAGVDASRAPDAPPEADTGDVRAEETVAVDEAARARRPGPARERASTTRTPRRAAARRLGQQARRDGCSGLPAASEDDGQLSASCYLSRAAADDHHRLRRLSRPRDAVLQGVPLRRGAGHARRRSRAPGTIRRWRREAPQGFVFALLAPQGHRAGGLPRGQGHRDGAEEPGRRRARSSTRRRPSSARRPSSPRRATTRPR